MNNEQDDDKDAIKDEYVDLYAKRPFSNTKVVKKNVISATDIGKTVEHNAIPYGQIDFLHDLYLELSVEFGRTKIKLKDIINMQEGSICMLQRFLGEPVDVVVGKKFMAKGEIVIVNERYGIRLSEVIRGE